MAALTAVVVALSVAVAANFLLLLAIVRRLRVQRPAPQAAINLPRVGMQAPAFTATDSTGRAIDDAFFKEAGEAVVVFLSEDCPPCENVKSELVRNPIVDPVLAFVQSTGDGSNLAQFVAAITETGAQTVIVEKGSDLPARFSISAFPTLLRLRDGVVVASSVKLADVRTGDATTALAHRRPAVAHSVAEQ